MVVLVILVIKSFHMITLLNILKRKGKLEPGSTLYCNCDGAAKQYRCANALYYLSLLAYRYKISIKENDWKSKKSTKNIPYSKKKINLPVRTGKGNFLLSCILSMRIRRKINFQSKNIEKILW